MDLVTDFRTWGGVHTASYFAQQDVRPNEATREILTDFRHTSRDGTAGTGFKYNPNKGIRGECTSMEDYSSFKRTYEPAFEQLGIKGKYSLYDFRTTYGTELCEADISRKRGGMLMIRWMLKLLFAPLITMMTSRVSEFTLFSRFVQPNKESNLLKYCRNPKEVLIYEEVSFDSSDLTFWLLICTS